MRSGGSHKLARKRGIYLSRREKIQLVILALAMVTVLLMAMAIGVRTSH